MNDNTQKTDESTFFRYTPVNGSSNNGAQDESRIVRMVEAPVDPMEPPKFHNKKLPRRPPSPPVPVMHSPGKKMTKQDLENWKIAPCVSNWKNPKGYTIALDKRLAADGRGLQEVQINDGFAKFSEALYIAEQKARQEIEERGKLQKMLLIKQNEEQEEKLRRLAQRARVARIGGIQERLDEDDTNERMDDSEDDEETSRSGRRETSSNEASDARRRMISHHIERSASGTNNHDDNDDRRTNSEDEEEERKRNRLREERAMEREREKRKNKNKKTYGDEDDRDITEKVALGQIKATNTSDQIDSRLYNFASGLDSGFGGDDTYGIYDQPLTKGSSVNQIYRPRQEAIDAYNDDTDSLMNAANDRFAKTKSFLGSADDGSGKRQSSREGLGPVQFERESAPEPKSEDKQKPPTKRRQEGESDEYGFGALMSEVRDKKKSSSSLSVEADPFGLDMSDNDSSRRGKKRALDHIGNSGFMSANAGASSGAKAEDYRESKRKRIDFERGR